MDQRRNGSPSYIIGISHEYPIHTVLQYEFRRFVEALYPDYAKFNGLRRLIAFNEKTGIDLRRTVQDQSKWTKMDARPPSIEDLSHAFRTLGVDLALVASKRAVAEACVAPADITHVVAVTCTDQGNPGFDLLVSQGLRLNPDVERNLLHGVGCAGGLSMLRVASALAAAATQRGHPARILVISCELCSLFLRAELYAACEDDALHIASALFSDAAAAVVVCNRLALKQNQVPIYELGRCGTIFVPNTIDQMQYEVQSNGLIATITKDVPATAVGAIPSLFGKLVEESRTYDGARAHMRVNPTSYDWAIHPGGTAILRGVQQALSLSDNHIRAALEVYRSNGNSSSATVLIVLDKLRTMNEGREQVVATSFGPGITVEMVLMRRCQFPDRALDLSPAQRETRQPWRRLQSRLLRACVRLIAGKQIDKDSRWHRL